MSRNNFVNRGVSCRHCERSDMMYVDFIVRRHFPDDDNRIHYGCGFCHRTTVVYNDPWFEDVNGGKLS